MSCCHGKNNHKENEHKGKHNSHLSHMWMMIICCGAPILLLLLLPLLGKALPGASVYLAKIIPLLCPIMMMAMLPMMLRKDRGNTENKPGDHDNLKDNA